MIPIVDVQVENMHIRNNHVESPERYNYLVRMIPAAMSWNGKKKGGNHDQSQRYRIRLPRQTDLLNLGLDHGVLHVVLQSLGIALALLQDRLHDRVVLIERRSLFSCVVSIARKQQIHTMIFATSGSRIARSRACSSVSP